MLLAGYLLSKCRRNRTTDVEYSNIVDFMHVKRRHRLCDGKIVSIYFLVAGRNKYFCMKPLPRWNRKQLTGSNGAGTTQYRDSVWSI